MGCPYYYKFFGSLANPLKIQIVEELKRKPQTVSELIENIKEEQSKVSHALANLKSCSIVESKREGKNIIYSLNKETIIPILKIIDEHQKKRCNGSCMK